MNALVGGRKREHFLFLSIVGIAAKKGTEWNSTWKLPSILLTRELEVFLYQERPKPLLSPIRVSSPVVEGGGCQASFSSFLFLIPKANQTSFCSQQMFSIVRTQYDNHSSYTVFPSATGLLFIFSLPLVKWPMPLIFLLLFPSRSSPLVGVTELGWFFPFAAAAVREITLWWVISLRKTTSALPLQPEEEGAFLPTL